MGDKLLGKKINYVRKQKKMTSEKLAELCDVNAGHIRQIEAETRLPSFRLFVEICNSLMVSPNYLLEQELIVSEDYEGKYKSIFQKVKKLTPNQIKTLDYLFDAVMELSQLFMQLLSKGEPAVSALEACNKALCKKMDGIYEPEDCIPYFFYTNEKGEILRPNEAYDELVEFWQVYREFDADISEDIKKELWILEMLYETDNYRASCENKKRKEKLSERQWKIIEKLCRVIKEVYGKKYVVLLDTDQDAYRVWEKIRLDRYGQEGNFFEDAHVENELMKLMDKGGLEVLVVGHGGLTPKRLYGVELHGGGFKRLKEYVGKRQWEIHCLFWWVRFSFLTRTG